MVEYFIEEFYRTNSVSLEDMVTDTFRFHMTQKLPLPFKAYVRMAEVIRNIVKLNVFDLRSVDDFVFKMDYKLDVLVFSGGFGKEIVGEITVTLIGDLVDKIEVTRSRHDHFLDEHVDVDEWR